MFVVLLVAALVCSSLAEEKVSQLTTVNITEYTDLVVEINKKKTF
jgi:hypothetical protein